MHYSTGNSARRRRLIPCLLLACALFSTPAAASHEANEPSDGTVNSFRWLKNPPLLPEISVEHWPDRRVSLSSYRGKIVLLNLWASWCPPCVRELPALDRLQQRLGGEHFAVVAISLDRSPEPARAMFVDRLALEHLDFFIEPAEQLGKFFPIDVLPSNFIIDRDGRVIGILRSFVDWESREAEEFVERLIDGSLPPRKN
jgi:thiol-disulfide isomerase/thioredoxin